MFKFIVVVLLFVIGAALYEQNQISLMNDEQKLAVIVEQQSIEQKRSEDKQAQLLLDKAYSEKMDKLSNTPWAEVAQEQYVEKVIANKTYLWLLLLLVPTILFQLSRTWDNATRGH